MLVAGYIPCRKGSTRLKNKNFDIFANSMSLADMAIDQGMSSKFVNKVLVDTDNDEFLSTLMSISAPKQVIGLRRPDRLATSSVATLDTMLHMIGLFEEMLEQTIDVIVLLQPTSPLRRWQTIDLAIQEFHSRKTPLITAVTQCPINLSDTVFIDPLDLSVVNCISKPIEDALFVTGAFYILTRDRLLNHTNPFRPTVKEHLFMTPFDEFIDIDYPCQYDLARTIFKDRSNNYV